MPHPQQDMSQRPPTCQVEGSVASGITHGWIRPEGQQALDDPDVATGTGHVEGRTSSVVASIHLCSALGHGSRHSTDVAHLPPHAHEVCTRVDPLQTCDSSPLLLS